MKKLAILLTLAFLSLFSCRKDVDESLSETIENNPPIITTIDYEPEVDPVYATIFGIVQTETEIPIENAIVRIVGEITYTTTTDEKGRFFFRDTTMNQAGTYLTVSKTGYFEGSDRFFPREASINYTKITLLNKSSIGSFLSIEGGTISSADSISLYFPPNSIVTQDGENFEGTVNVLAQWIDPTADNLGEIMPGNLQGLNSDLDYVSLFSAGMIAVELESTTGESLNLGNGETATMTITVPDELLNTAPAEIPLWYFHEELGLWIEDGKAELVGNQYVGEVSHFTFWNYDGPLPSIVLSGTAVSSDGSSFQNAEIKITTTDGWHSGHGYTDNIGFFQGAVIADQILNIEIYFNNNCTAYTSTIGPFSQDTDIGEIVISAPNQIDFSGTIVDCDNNPLTNGYLVVNIGGTDYSYYINFGTINASIVYCTNETELTVVTTDLTNSEESDEQTFTISNSLDLGNILACGNQLTEWLTVSIDNGPVTTFPSLDYIYSIDSIQIYADDTPNSSFNVAMRMKDITGPGTYNESNINHSYHFISSNSGGTLSNTCGFYTPFSDCDYDSFVITALGTAPGEFIEGYYEGTLDFKDNNNQTATHFIEVDFKIELD